MQLTPKTKNHQPVEMPGKPTNAKQQPCCACLPNVGRY
jgi:hypothetical protein